jgi:HEAT repeat protein
LHLTDTCPLLGPLLADEDPDVQLAAARALSRRRDRQAAALLIGAIETGALPPERIVERVSERWAVPALLESLRRARARPAGDAGAAVVPLGASLAQALGLAGATEAESDLIGLLRGGGFEERISAARALAAVGGQRSLAGLIDALENDEWQVRGQAASALGAQPGPDAVRALTGAMSDRSWWVRANAGRALRALAEPGVAALRETASSSKDAFARDRAREELAVAELEGLAA